MTVVTEPVAEPIPVEAVAVAPEVEDTPLTEYVAVWAAAPWGVGCPSCWAESEAAMFVFPDSQTMLFVPCWP